MFRVKKTKGVADLSPLNVPKTDLKIVAINKHISSKSMLSKKCELLQGNRLFFNIRKKRLKIHHLKNMPVKNQ